MKRTYVKPVMESEAFVANEYVAACWTFACEGGGTGVYKTDDENYEPTENTEKGDPFFTVGGKWGYNGKDIENCDGSSWCAVADAVAYIFGVSTEDIHSLKDKPQKSNAS